MNIIKKILVFSGSTLLVFFCEKIFKESKALFKIHRTLSTKNIEIQYLPLSVVEKYQTKNTGERINPKYIKYIVDYYYKIKKEIPHADLTIYKRNIKDLQIREVCKLKNKKASANYNVVSNRITKLRKYNEKVINHELLHMSSAFNIVNNYFMGFSQYHDGISQKVIGKGLDEGYSTLIDESYFGGVNYSDIYELLYIIAYILQLIIGKEEMEKLYFSADLYHVVETLKQYNSKSNIIKFLNNTDLLLCCNQNTIIEKYYIQKSLYKITEFLIETYSTKQLNLLYNNKISEDVMWNKILFLVDTIDNEVEHNNKKYKFSKISSIYEIISKLSHIQIEQVDIKRKKYVRDVHN